MDVVSQPFGAASADAEIFFNFLSPAPLRLTKRWSDILGVCIRPHQHWRPKCSISYLK